MEGRETKGGSRGGDLEGRRGELKGVGGEMQGGEGRKGNWR